jgi:hypothetical protein
MFCFKNEYVFQLKSRREFKCVRVQNVSKRVLDVHVIFTVNSLNEGQNIDPLSRWDWNLLFNKKILI